MLSTSPKLNQSSINVFVFFKVCRARGCSYIPAQPGLDMTPRGHVLFMVCLANVLVLGGVVHAYLTTRAALVTVHARMQSRLQEAEEVVHDDGLCDLATTTSAACKRVSANALATMGLLVSSALPRHARVVPVGRGFGLHHVMDSGGALPCVFYSYGVAHDRSFDSQIASLWNCSGVLLDPTVTLPSRLQGDELQFIKAGAAMLGGSAYRTLTPVQLMKRYGHARVHLLKMDCEGCEYALVEELHTDPQFLRRVDQVVLEVHLSKKWASTRRHVHNLGLLYHALFAAGFRLLDVQITGCAPEDEATGCVDEFRRLGFPCGHAQHCHNYLFAKHPGAVTV